jgi:hypothetical protein
VMREPDIQAGPWRVQAVVGPLTRNALERALERAHGIALPREGHCALRTRSDQNVKERNTISKSLRAPVGWAGVLQRARLPLPLWRSCGRVPRCEPWQPRAPGASLCARTGPDMLHDWCIRSKLRSVSISHLACVTEEQEVGERVETVLEVGAFDR